jgi:hypothetical protein
MHLRILILAVLLGASRSSATTFENVTTAELADRAEVVAVVTCESCRPEMDRQSGLVFTRVRLSLLEELKGSAGGSTMELLLVGGELDGVRTVVAGMPVFRAGEECILLLGKRNRAGHPTVVAARRGMVRLARDKQGTRFLRDAVSGFGAMPGTRAGVELEAFRTAFRETMRARAKKRAEAAKPERGPDGGKGDSK